MDYPLSKCLRLLNFGLPPTANDSLVLTIITFWSPPFFSGQKLSWTVLGVKGLDFWLSLTSLSPVASIRSPSPARYRTGRNWRTCGRRLLLSIPFTLVNPLLFYISFYLELLCGVETRNNKVGIGHCIYCIYEKSLSMPLWKSYSLFTCSCFCYCICQANCLCLIKN